MIFALFGVTCVGKTAIGKIISERLGYEFYDMDAEIKSFYKDTLTNIYSDCFNRYAIDKKKAAVLQVLLNKCGGDVIIAMSPIYYTKMYKIMLAKKNVFSIVLEDAPENIADRMICTDAFDLPIENIKPNRQNDIKDVKYFISRYKNAHNKIQCHFQINGKSASESADTIIREIINQAI